MAAFVNLSPAAVRAELVRLSQRYGDFSYVQLAFEAFGDMVDGAALKVSDQVTLLRSLDEKLPGFRLQEAAIAADAITNQTAELIMETRQAEHGSDAEERAILHIFTPKPDAVVSKASSHARRGFHKALRAFDELCAKLVICYAVASEHDGDCGFSSSPTGVWLEYVFAVMGDAPHSIPLPRGPRLHVRGCDDVLRKSVAVVDKMVLGIASDVPSLPDSSPARDGRHSGSLPATPHFVASAPSVSGETDESAPWYVTLEEAATMASTPKKTLESWKHSDKLPEPARPHSGRRAAKWRWDELRPALESLTGLTLPTCPPREATED